MARLTRKQRQSQSRAITRGKIRRLQKAGLMSQNINPNKKPSKYVLAKLYTYRGVLSGRQAAVQVSTAAKAKELRSKIGDGGQGKVVIVPREKGERFRVTKDDQIKSTRKAFGQTVEKTIGDKFTPRPGERAYYTIPRRKRGLGQLKRHTFASEDELLKYLETYEINFDDIKDYIEVERFKEGSAAQKREHEEYKAAVRKLKYKRRKRRKSRR